MLQFLHSKRCEKRKRCGCSPSSRSGLEHHFARLSIPLLDGIDDSQRGRRAKSQMRSISDPYRLGEIQVQQRLRRREFKDLSVLIEPVKAALAQAQTAVLSVEQSSTAGSAFFFFAPVFRPFGFSGSDGFGGGWSGKKHLEPRALRPAPGAGRQPHRPCPSSLPARSSAQKVRPMRAYSRRR